MSNPFVNWLQRATPFEWATNLTALAAVITLSLVIYGFRRYIRRPHIAPIDFIGTGIWLLCFFKMTRLLWWDLLPDLLDIKWSSLGLNGSNVNWIFNLGVMAGCWYMLKGFHMLVEEKAPGEYNVWTSVFYPRRLRLWIMSRLDE